MKKQIILITLTILLEVVFFTKMASCVEFHITTQEGTIHDCTFLNLNKKEATCENNKSKISLPKSNLKMVTVIQNNGETFEIYIEITDYEKLCDIVNLLSTNKKNESGKKSTVEQDRLEIEQMRAKPKNRAIDAPKNDIIDTPEIKTADLSYQEEQRQAESRQQEEQKQAAAIRDKNTEKDEKNIKKSSAWQDLKGWFKGGHGEEQKQAAAIRDKNTEKDEKTVKIPSPLSLAIDTFKQNPQKSAPPHIVYGPKFIGYNAYLQVDIDTACNVFAVNANNYELNKRGEDFSYFGGQANRSPVILKPPTGSYYVVIDKAGAAGRVKALVQVIE